MKNETLTVGQNPLPLLRYDGKMSFYYQFTEHDETKLSHGATFYVPIAEFSTEALIAKRASKLEEFSRCALL